MQENNPPISSEPITPPVSVPSQTSVPEVHPLEPKKPILLIVLAIFLVLSLGSIAFMLFQNIKLQNQVSQLQKSLASKPTSIPNPVSTTDPIATWQTYTNSKIGYIIKYPSNWQIQLLEPSAEQASQGNNTTTISVTKDNYSLKITTSSLGGGGIICKFDDSTNDQIAGPAIDKLGTPYEIGTFLNQSARRNLNPITKTSQYGTESESISYTFEACVPIENDIKRSDDKTAYTSTINNKNTKGLIVYNGYYTPSENINSENLKTMDQILSTFKFTN